MCDSVKGTAAEAQAKVVLLSSPSAYLRVQGKAVDGQWKVKGTAAEAQPKAVLSPRTG